MLRTPIVEKFTNDKYFKDTLQHQLMKKTKVMDYKKHYLNGVSVVSYDVWFNFNNYVSKLMAGVGHLNFNTIQHTMELAHRL